MNLKLAGLCIVLLGLIIWSRITITNTPEVFEIEIPQQKQIPSEALSTNITPPQLTKNGPEKSQPTVYSPKHSNVLAQAHAEKKLPAQKKEVIQQDWIEQSQDAVEQNSSATQRYEIIDLSNKHTPFTKIIKPLKPRDKWSAVMGTGSISVTNTHSGHISEFFIGNAEIEELWTRHIDFDAKKITVYDKFELKNVPSGYLYAENCKQEYYEHLSINAIVKYKEEYAALLKKYKEDPSTTMPIEHRFTSDVLLAWYFDEEKMRYLALEDTENVRCLWTSMRDTMLPLQ